MRGLTCHSRRLQMFRGRKGGSLAILAKPTGRSELPHRHGMERRSWQGTRLMLPPLTLLLRAHAFSQLMFSPP